MSWFYFSKMWFFFSCRSRKLLQNITTPCLNTLPGPGYYGTLCSTTASARTPESSERTSLARRSRPVRGGFSLLTWMSQLLWLYGPKSKHTILEAVFFLHSLSYFRVRKPFQVGRHCSSEKSNKTLLCHVDMVTLIPHAERRNNAIVFVLFFASAAETSNSKNIEKKKTWRSYTFSWFTELRRLLTFPLVSLAITLDWLKCLN